MNADVRGEDAGETILDVLWRRARHDADDLAFVMLSDGETESERCTYAELADRVRAIAGALRRHVAPGDRVMVLHAMGIEYVASLLGCFAAGAIAIPLHRPRRGRGEQRFALIRKDSAARLALTSGASLQDVRAALEDDSIACLGGDDIVAAQPLDDVNLEAVNRGADSDVAYLQYTSGSTGTPRGVMVSHANLFANVRDIATAIPYGPASRMVNWLPLYHDMGLVFGAMYPLYAGFPCYLMEPSAFQQEPLQWLRAISRFRGTHTGAPTFAFALCADHAASADLTGLDLSSCEAAMCGAEPLHVETLARFSNAFAPHGFRAEAIGAGYGLAESTLMVTVQLGGVQAIDVSAAALATGQIRPPAADGDGARPVVSVGTAGSDTTILVVDAERGEPSARDVTGEVWVAGPAVSSGYWNRPEETSATFGATMAGHARPFLRTGDLGFQRDGRLYVTGRLKDLIIVRGRNHYPQDIEWTVGDSHGALRLNAGAAFSTDVDGVEALVVAQEVRRAAVRSLDVDAVVRAIRVSVIEKHGVAPHAVILLKPGGLPVTSSGKPRRRDCRRLFEEGSLAPVAEWRLKPASNVADDIADVDRSYAALESWLRERAARQLGVPIESIDVRESFARHGFDSLAATELAAALARRLRQPISPTLAYDYPSIAQLARHLSVDGAERSARAKSNRARPASRSADCPIAVVGMACRLPGAPDLNAYERLLFDGRDAVRELPPERWTAAFRHALGDAPATDVALTRGGWLDNVDGFDEQFFGISAREAAYVDPQQRLLLEVAWEALEHGAIAPDSLAGREVGVFIGISDAEYRAISARSADRLHPWVGTGTALSVAANRVSYVLDLKGPSLAIDTACSSSLVALHEACEKLREHRVELSIAGGVNLILTPNWSVVFARAGMLSRDGRCKTFDAAADGYVRGEGCGVVVLKRLDDALRDGDRVHAVVLGSAVNHDGKSNGLTAPNGPAQQDVARRGLASAGVSAGAVGYVEAHGTGTALGDPIELNALRAVYGDSADEPCRVGAVKSNIGHLEAAAGIAGFIKTVLVLEHGVIPQNLHFSSLNPEIHLRGSRMTVAAERSDWARPLHGRHAAVSAFGFGGANAHIIIREAPGVAAESSPARGAPRVLAFSARDPVALRTMAERYSTVLAGMTNDADALDAMCRTAALGRARFEHPAAVAGSSASAMRAALEAWIEDSTRSDVPVRAPRPRQAARVAFLFTGQGALRTGAGRVLFDREPVFREALLRCDVAARRTGVSIIEALEDDALATTSMAQPVLFALEHGLAELWRSLGVVPYAVMGHSLGEYAAACVAGVLEMEDAMRIVVERGRWTQALAPGGAMLAVNAAETDVSRLLHSRGLTIAAINAPDQLVLSGDADSLTDAAAELAAAAIETSPLRVAHAFHHPRMNPIVDPLRDAFRQVTLRAPSIPLISNVSGAVAGAEVVDSEYWGKHTLMPVRFMDGVRALATLGCDVFMEIGPAPVLLPLAARSLSADADVRWVAGLRPGRDDHEALAGSLAELHAAGVEIDWSAVHAGTSTERAELPTYPFQRRRHWVVEGTAEERDVLPAAQPPRAMGVRRIASASDREALFDARLDPRSTPYLADHRVAGKLWTPAASFISMGVEACAALNDGARLSFESVRFMRPLALDPDVSTAVQIVVSLPTDATRTLQIASAAATPGEPWTRHVVTTLVPDDAPARLADIAALRSTCSERVPVETVYARLGAAGLHYGASLRGVRELYRGDGAILARVASGDDTGSMRDAAGPMLHPVLLDACFQSLAALLPDLGVGVFVPASIARLRVSGAAGAEAWCYAVLRATTDGLPRVDLDIISANSSTVIASVEGLALGRADTAGIADLPGDCVHAMQWLPQPIAAEGDAAWPPKSAEICAAAEVALSSADARDALLAYTSARPVLEAGSRAYAIAALRAVGALSVDGARTTAELASAAGISAQHHPLFARLLSLAAEDGVVRRDDDRWMVLEREGPDPLATLSPIRGPAHRASPELALLDACGPIMADVLTGRCDPLAALFGDGEKGAAPTLYRESSGAFVLNSAARAALGTLLRRAPAARPLRILEIGGGTGGTTAALLEALEGAAVEYTFTDVAILFLTQARLRFGARDGFLARALDIERAPASQGILVRELRCDRRGERAARHARSRRFAVQRPRVARSSRNAPPGRGDDAATLPRRHRRSHPRVVALRRPGVASDVSAARCPRMGAFARPQRLRRHRASDTWRRRRKRSRTIADHRRARRGDVVSLDCACGSRGTGERVGGASRREWGTDRAVARRLPGRRRGSARSRRGPGIGSSAWSGPPLGARRANDGRFVARRRNDGRVSRRERRTARRRASVGEWRRYEHAAATLDRDARRAARSGSRRHAGSGGCAPLGNWPHDRVRAPGASMRARGSGPCAESRRCRLSHDRTATRLGGGRDRVPSRREAGGAYHPRRRDVRRHRAALDDRRRLHL